MSAMTLPHAIERLRTTPASSPLALFALPPDKGGDETHVDVVFANTALTRRLIAQGEPTYIGTFHGEMTADSLREHIERLGTAPSMFSESTPFGAIRKQRAQEQADRARG